MNIPPIDQPRRELALNPEQSFIVQAPAGSGKTELLVQRFLILLSRAKTPEEIIAITFTRKAANEMRARILDALNNAANSNAAAVNFNPKTCTIAKLVLEQNARQHWDIINNPNRLRIFTIDALSSSLTRQMPVLSQFGALPDIIENAQPLYQKAVHALLTTLESEQDWSPALQQLLIHLDNNFVTAEKLLLRMLARRDQWLPYILEAKKNHISLREKLENSLVRIVCENMTSCYENFPLALQTELLELIHFSADNLKRDNVDSEITACLNLITLPTAELKKYPQWLGIATLLLTKDQQWRKSINKNQGFPPNNASMKQRMLLLLEQLEQQKDLQQSLTELVASPAIKYSDQQWQIVAALLQLLPVLAAQLTLIFKEKGAVDFIEVAAAARRVLGEIDAPTDLALSLDYQIRHLLIDEFQDTAISQFRLLELLTAGWQQNDGRTLFLVGDPMQSIYRFRQAEVGLFLRAKHKGIGQIRLHSLELQVNFRSNANIVQWLNANFKTIFPAHENFSAGAVPFTPCIAKNTTLSVSDAVSIYAFIDSDDIAQAQQIINIINTCKTQDPLQTIAILVRSRSHIPAIIAALKNAQIKYCGVELETLGQQSVIQDLFALTKALKQLADRIAWYAILRAPWCGLTLADLHALAKVAQQGTLWDALQHAETVVDLSTDGKLRIARIMDVLIPGIKNRQRQNLRCWIEDIWRALGGPACITTIELEYAAMYFKLLEEITANAELDDFAQLESRLSTIYAPPNHQADHTLQIITIHKAKGLEFDTIILPYLEKMPMHDENSLLLWMERPTQHGENDLILAPIKSISTKEDTIYNYLRHQETKKSHYETARLLYVATTRARHKLHLLGNVKHDANMELKPPTDNSLLHFLWPVIKTYFIDNKRSWLPHKKLEPSTDVLPQFIKRLKSTWHLPTDLILDKHPLPSDIKIMPIKNKIPDLIPRAIGTLVHQALQRISSDGIKYWHVEKIKQQHHYWKNFLIKMGILLADIDPCLIAIETALIKTVTDSRGQWILDNRHQHAHCEYPITLMLDNKATHLIIDRTFIDKDTCWIIDYKTTAPEHISPEEFFVQQRALHQKQLQTYAIAMLNLLQKNTIRLGLYFPLFAGWCEWEFQDTMGSL